MKKRILEGVAIAFLGALFVAMMQIAFSTVKKPDGYIFISNPIRIENKKSMVTVILQNDNKKSINNIIFSISKDVGMPSFFSDYSLKISPVFSNIVI